MESQHTSLSLLDRLASQHDSDDWQRLSDIYSPILRQWIHKYGVQAADADDLVQEVLTTLHREVGSFQHSARKGAFRAWLRGVLVNRLRDYWRSKKYRPNATGMDEFAIQLNELADDRGSLTQLWDAEYDREVMQRLLRLIECRFEPQTWQAFKLQMIDGLGAKAVSEQLGVSLGVAYAAKSRVLQALRQEARGLVD